MLNPFTEANQARLALKMKLHIHAWYNSSMVGLGKNEYVITVFVRYKHKNIKKIVPPTFNGFDVRIEEIK